MANMTLDHNLQLLPPNNFGVRAMVFSATFNHLAVISWRSVLLVEKIGGPAENNRPAVSH